MGLRHRIDDRGSEGPIFKGPKTAETVYLAMRVEETLGNQREASKYAKELLAGFPNSREAMWVKQRMKPRR